MSMAAALMRLVLQESNRPTIKPEDVFRPFYYIGSAAARTLDNDLDLSEAGCMVWGSPRNGTYDQFWSSRGIDLSPNTNEANFASGNYGPRPVAGGVSLTAGAPYNESGVPYMSWSFKKHKRFFTTVTYTGNGAQVQTIAHDLGVRPGFIVVKRVDAASNWATWHRNFGGYYMQLNAAGGTSIGVPRFGTVTSTYFNVCKPVDPTHDDTNAAGAQYIAYIFGHDASLINCGSVVVEDGSASISLGWEPQFLLLKSASSGSANPNWNVMDSSRGWASNPKTIRLNGGGTEYSSNSGATPTASGFDLAGLTNGTYYFMAIRKPTVSVSPGDGTAPPPPPPPPPPAPTQLTLVRNNLDHYITDATYSTSSSSYIDIICTVDTSNFFSKGADHMVLAFDMAGGQGSNNPHCGPIIRNGKNMWGTARGFIIFGDGTVKAERWNGTFSPGIGDITNIAGTSFNPGSVHTHFTVRIKAGYESGPYANTMQIQIFDGTATSGPRRFEGSINWSQAWTGIHQFCVGAIANGFVPPSETGCVETTASGSAALATLPFSNLALRIF